MLLLIFLVLVPIFRLVTFFYRRSRLKSLNKIYDNYISGEPLKSKLGKPISFYQYQPEITNLMELCGVDDFIFSAQKSQEAMFKTQKAFHRAIGSMWLEIKRSFFPNTYLRYLVNLPMMISKKVGITPSKSLALVLYLLYIGIGYVDTATAVYKIIELVSSLSI